MIYLDDPDLSINLALTLSSLFFSLFFPSLLDREETFCREKLIRSEKWTCKRIKQTVIPWALQKFDEADRYWKPLNQLQQLKVLQMATQTEWKRIKQFYRNAIWAVKLNRF